MKGGAESGVVTAVDAESAFEVGVQIGFGVDDELEVEVEVGVGFDVDAIGGCL
jgi:hypothetical protein